MLAMDKDLLLCDMAQFYGIYDLQAFPMRYVATLACGLGSESRIMKKAMGVVNDPPIFALCAHILDSINNFAWGFSGDKRNRPQSMVERIFERKKEGQYKGFDTGAEFEKERKKILDHGK